MVTVILRGGLGNQMFQYAAGLDVALKKNTMLVMDTTYLNDRFPRPQFTYRNYDLDIFKIDPQFTKLSNIASSTPIPGLWLGIDLAYLALHNIAGGKKNQVLWDFYQGEQYFVDNKEAVRAAFQFRHPLIGEAIRLSETIQKTNSVSIHVRRGDYRLPKYEKLYGATDIAYYERAVAYIVERIGATTKQPPHFFVFSDDIAWCREHIKPAFATTYLDDASRGPKASFHLELMSLCQHNIIANSSFSWWGAWLNRNPGKIVVGPKRWHYDDRDDEAGDVMPGTWKKL